MRKELKNFLLVAKYNPWKKAVTKEDYLYKAGCIVDAMKIIMGHMNSEKNPFIPDEEMKEEIFGLIDQFYIFAKIGGGIPGMNKLGITPEDARDTLKVIMAINMEINSKEKE